MKFWVLFKKEFKETIRDKSVLLSNFVFPLLSLPMIVIFSVFATGIMAINMKEERIKILADRDIIKQLEAMKVERFDYVSIAERLEFPLSKEKERSLLKQYDLVIVKSKKSENNKKFVLHLISDSSNTKNYIALQNVQRFYKKFLEKEYQENLKKHNLTPADLNSFDLDVQDRATLMKIASQSFGGQAGVVIFVLLIVGMYYPAINAFIGEKDKKTMNVLIFNTDNEKQIILAKYLNIVAFGMLTFVPYMIDYIIIKTMMGDKLAKTPSLLQISGDAYLILAMNLFILAFVLGIISIIISIMSKTMTRAQSFLSGMLMLMMIPIIFLNIVKEKMTFKMALIPIMNFFYLARDFALDQVALDNSIIAFLVNMFFSYFLFTVAYKKFKKQFVLKQ